ncbi:MAG TPA: hypothetical protein VHX19_06130 [Stellaceae bacterium]|nr:hypothetical protein [Stellaceae bacterium]
MAAKKKKPKTKATPKRPTAKPKSPAAKGTAKSASKSAAKRAPPKAKRAAAPKVAKPRAVAAKPQPKAKPVEAPKPVAVPAPSAPPTPAPISPTLVRPGLQKRADVMPIGIVRVLDGYQLIEESTFYSAPGRDEYVQRWEARGYTCRFTPMNN